MLIELSHVPNNLTIRLFDREGDNLIEAIDAIVDPAGNPAQPEMLEILTQLWLKLHSARSH